MQRTGLEKWTMKNEVQEENELLDKMPGWIKILMGAIQKTSIENKDSK
jgi:hypothetical protein